MAKSKHAVETTETSLTIEEHLKWQERGWMVQRFGWVLIFLIPVLGLLGLFGDGLLSDQKIVSGPLTTEYEKFARYEKEMTFVMKSAEPHIASIALPQAYLKNFKIVRIIPEPEGNTSVNGQVVYRFNPAANKIVTLYASPKQTGSISGTLTVNNHSIPLHHFIYP